MWTHPQSGRQLLHVKCGITSARHSGGCCGEQLLSSCHGGLVTGRYFCGYVHPSRNARGPVGTHTRHAAPSSHAPTHAGKIWPNQQLCNSPTHPLRAYPVRLPPDTCRKSLCCLLQRSRVAPKQGVPRMHHHLTPARSTPTTILQSTREDSLLAQSSLSAPS